MKKKQNWFVLGAAVAASGTMTSTAAAAAPAQGVPAMDTANAGSTAAGTLQSARDQRVMDFAIPAGPLDVVLAQFQRVTGIKAEVAVHDILNVQSPGVSGRMSVAQALDRLLAGTLVEATTVDATTIRLSMRTLAESVDVLGVTPQPASPKYTEPLRDTPATVVVIPQTVLQEQGATSLRDALRNTPGITLTAGEGGTAPGDNFLIRGFSARNDVYIDGARDPGVASRDTFNTEAVEVAKGPSSVVAGRGSAGGSINMVTKAANATDATSMQFGGGSADYKRFTADINRRISKTAAVRLNLMGQDSGVPRRDVVKNKGWGLAPSLALGLGTPTQVTINYQRLQQNNIPDYGLPATLPDLANAQGITVTDLDFSNFYGLAARDHEKLTSDVGTVTVDHRFSPQTSVRNLTRYGRNYLDRIVTPPRAASASNGGADPFFDPTVPQMRRTDTKYQERDDKSFTNQTDLTTRFETGAIRHAFVAGLELSHDNQPSYALTDAFTNGRPPVTDLFHPDPYQAYTPALVRTGAATEGHANSQAVYAFDTLKMGKVQADLSVRGDHVHVDYANTATTGVTTSFSRTDKALSGRAGVVYKPVERGSLYAAYSTSFTPSFDGSFGLTLAATGGNSQALPPERSRNVEVGTKWDVRNGLFASIAVFRTDKTNAKTTDASGATVLAGNQHVQGAELGLSGNLTRAWQVFGGLSVMQSKIDDSGNAAEVDKQLSYVPKSSFNIWSTYQIARVTVGGGAQYTDGYYFNNTNAITTANAQAIRDLTRYWLYSAVATCELNKHVSVQVNGLNLSNARYVDRGYSGHFIPGPGRAVIFSPIVTF
ncbi:MAG TPA: TonB-dependent siderophore receptor [Vicinamibacterales bacterium]|nr:TonB-dependent siderophore receptor [Vicinamibacterales bacterium]